MVLKLKQEIKQTQLLCPKREKKKCLYLLIDKKISHYLWKEKKIIISFK